MLEKLRAFTELRKLSKKSDGSYKTLSLAVLGDSATQHLAAAIRGYGQYSGYNVDLFDADYNQIQAQTMDPHSELYQFDPKNVLLFYSTEKLHEAFSETPIEERASFAERQLKKISTAWSNLNRYSSAGILQFLFIEEDDMVFGSYSPNLEISFLYQVKKLNYLLMEKKREFANVYLIDLNDLAMNAGREHFRDQKMLYIAKMVFSLEILPHVAKRVISVLSAMNGKVKKCVVLDLDNTLWGGVIGDDGLEGIEIGELGQGHAFSDLQTWLKELKNRGIILGVCSKNNDDTAREPFLKHPEMVLRMEDISIFVANWNDKATNLRYIQKTLNIGMDSIVFLDDNPFERNLVKQMIPDITVPDLPEDPSLYVEYLKSLNLFETVSYSKEDILRTQQYQAEVNRQELEEEFESFDDYLKSLDMHAEVAPFDEFHFPRIAQLTQRSNQFNLRTVRYTEDEIRRIAADDHHITRYFTLRDKFGEYGLISVLIMDKQEEDTLFISEWLMSCRVLKRGMEEFIINEIISAAKENGFKRVIGEYLETKKNAMVRNIYPDHGFRKIDEGRYEILVEEYVPSKTFIEEERK